VTFLGAGAAALVCIPAAFLAERRVFLVERSWFAGSTGLFSVIACTAALVFLIVTRRRGTDPERGPGVPARFGEGRAIRALAWITMIVTGLWVGSVVVVVVQMMLFYDGKY